MAGVERISISVPPDLLEEFDKATETIGYKDRSKAIQVAMRNFVAEYTWSAEEGKRAAGGIMLTYDHRSHHVEEALTGIQHKYRDLISATTHMHLDESHCLEIISVRGEVRRIQELARAVMKTRNVDQLKLHMMSP
jgi:CopG family nickel-responsive transcriptional regulator